MNRQHTIENKSYRAKNISSIKSTSTSTLVPESAILTFNGGNNVGCEKCGQRPELLQRISTPTAAGSASGGRACVFNYAGRTGRLHCLNPIQAARLAAASLWMDSAATAVAAGFRSSQATLSLKCGRRAVTPHSEGGRLPRVSLGGRGGVRVRGGKVGAASGTSI